MSFPSSYLKIPWARLPDSDSKYENTGERNNPINKLIEAGKEYRERLSNNETQNKTISDTFSGADIKHISQEEKVLKTA